MESLDLLVATSMDGKICKSVYMYFISDPWCGSMQSSWSVSVLWYIRNKVEVVVRVEGEAVITVVPLNLT